MPRPDQSAAQRERLIPVVARAFAELGFRRATTAELARRCAVQENILYRLWADKKAMFLDAIAHIYDHAVLTWGRLLASSGGRGAAERLLEYEARHLGEFGLHRIVFAGLTEADDPEIRRAVVTMYRRFHGFVSEQVGAYRAGSGQPSPDATAWGILGLGTVAVIIRELGLASAAERQRLFSDVGRLLLEGRVRSRGPAADRPS